MLDTALVPKFPLAGSVSERSSPSLPLAGAAIGAVVCLLLALGAEGNRLRAAAAASTGAVAGITAVMGWEHAQLAWRDTFEWSVLGTVTLLAMLAPLIAARAGGAASPSPLADGWAHVRRHGYQALDTDTVLGLLRGLLLFAAAVAALLLLADPRYRDFPTLLYLVPALVFGVGGWYRRGRTGFDERVCAIVLAVSVTGRWLMEPANPQAVAWLATGLLFAAPFLRAATRDNE